MTEDLTPSTTDFVCDVCGYKAADLPTVVDHLRSTHGIDNAGEVGRLEQADGLLTMTSGDRVTVVNLEAWLADLLEGRPTP